MYEIKLENDKWNERLENRKIKSLKRVYSGKTALDITKAFVIIIKRSVKSATAKLNTEESEDIFKRLNLLTKENIYNCVAKAKRVLKYFNIAISAHQVIYETSKMLRMIVFMVRKIIFHFHKLFWFTFINSISTGAWT